MTKPALESDLVIYLLHFDAVVRRSFHYLGITTQKRLKKRMQEHAGATGANLTAEAAKMGIGFTMVRLFTSASHAQEARMKRNGHFARKCPICNPALDDLIFRAERVHYDPTWQAPRWSPLGWDPSECRNPAPAHEKRRLP